MLRGMKARAVFDFIERLFYDGVLPMGRSIWGCVYNLDRYPAAMAAALRVGMDRYELETWLREYARRSSGAEPLMLPVVVRWGEDDRPRRMVVQVPVFCMKDFDGLPDATLAALALEVDAAVDDELFMRDMRAPDVPEVWARVVVDGEEQEVQFNPLKLWRGEVKLCPGGCNLKDVRLVEWHVVGQREEVLPAPAVPAGVCARKGEPEAAPEVPPVVEAKAGMSEREAFWRCVAVFAVLLGLVVLGVRGCVQLFELPEFSAGYQVEVSAKGCSAWSNPDAFARYDRLRKRGEWKEARKVLREQREALQVKNLKAGEGGSVLRVGEVCPGEEDVRYLWVTFDDHGSWWVKSRDVKRQR